MKYTPLHISIKNSESLEMRAIPGIFMAVLIYIILHQKTALVL